MTEPIACPNCRAQIEARLLKSVHTMADRCPHCDAFVRDSEHSHYENTALRTADDIAYINEWLERESTAHGIRIEKDAKPERQGVHVWSVTGPAFPIASPQRYQVVYESRRPDVCELRLELDDSGDPGEEFTKKLIEIGSDHGAQAHGSRSARSGLGSGVSMCWGVTRVVNIVPAMVGLLRSAFRDLDETMRDAIVQRNRAG